MKRVAMMKEATFIKALISSLSRVWHVCGGVHDDRWCDVMPTYYERGRLRPEGVKVREKCDECGV